MPEPAGTDEQISPKGILASELNVRGTRLNKFICREGEIFYLGCATDPDVICTDWAVNDYALKPVGHSSN